MLKAFLQLFSRYVDPLEKRTDKVLHRLSGSSSRQQTEAQLLQLMQADLVILNVWLEYKFKGYKHLKKRKRRQLYANSEIIKAAFEQSLKTSRLTDEQITEQLLVLDAKLNKKQTERFRYLMEIMHFLKPNDRYKYLETTSFDRLLVNLDAGQVMIGDCNQIVTFYIYLYSLKYDVSDLQIKLLPGHVCLHFQGIDIESTSASFHKYQEDEILPITEIISTNLLDLHDYRAKSFKLSQQTILKSAQLAFVISSKRELVEQNLRAAYHNLGLSAADKHDYKAAVDFMRKAGSEKSIPKIYKNAAIHYSKTRKFRLANEYANKLGDRKFSQSITNQEAYYHFERGDFKKSLRLYRSVNNQEGIRACQQSQYNKLVEKVAKDKTLKQQKSHKSTYKQMFKLAQELNDPQLVSQLRQILDKI